MNTRTHSLRRFVFSICISLGAAHLSSCTHFFQRIYTPPGEVTSALQDEAVDSEVKKPFPGVAVSESPRPSVISEDLLTQKDESTSNHYEMGKQLRQEGLTSQALESLLAAWNEKRELPRLVSLVESYKNLKLSSEALTLLQQKEVIESFGTDPIYKKALAETYEEVNLPNLALPLYADLLTQDANNLSLWWHRYQCEMKLEQFPSALESLSKIAALGGEGELVHFEKAKVIEKSDPQNLVAIATELEQAISIQPSFKAARLKLADLYSQQEDWTKAQNTLMAFERRFGFDVDVYKALAENNFKQQEWQEAEDRYQYLSQNENFKILSLKRMAEIKKINGFETEAYQYYSQVLNLDPADDEVRVELIKFALNQGDLNSATEQAQAIAVDSEYFLPSQILLAEALSKKLENAPEEKTLQDQFKNLAERLITLYPQNPLAQSYAKATEKYREASSPNSARIPASTTTSNAESSTPEAHQSE